MNTFLLILALLGIVALLAKLVSWCGKCKNCGSWRNWWELASDYDSHKGHIFAVDQSKCSKCGHIKIIKKKIVGKVWRT
jgi:hypothetical protein